MAKTASIVIDIESSSLSTLNTEINQLEESISQLKIGTAEWNTQNQKLGTLKQKFADATFEASKLQKVVEKTTGAEQVQAIAKLGAGLVGAFAGVTGAIGLLGGSSEALDKVTAKGVQLLQVMGGLQAAADVFSKENLKGLIGIGNGFKTLLTTVRGVSAGMKAALISTGIGALIVGVGLLIAYWDDLKDLVMGTSREQEEAAKAAALASEEQIKAYGEQVTALTSKLAIEKEIAALTGDNVKASETEAELAVAKLIVTRKQLEQLEEQQAIQQQIYDEADTNTEEGRLAMANANNQITIIKAKLKEANAILEYQGRVIAVGNYEYRKNTEEIDKINNGLIKKINNLQILSSLENKERAIYSQQLSIINDQIAVLNLKKNTGEIYNKTLNDQIDALNTQKSALINQEATRRKLLATELKNINAEREYAKELELVSTEYSKILTSIEDWYTEISKNNQVLNENVGIAENMSKLYAEILEKKTNLFNFDKKGLELFSQQNEEATNLLSTYEYIVAETKLNLRNLLEGKDVNEKVLDLASRELTFFTQIELKIQDRLKNDKKVYELNLQSLVQDKQRLFNLSTVIQKQKEYLKTELVQAKLKLDNAKNDEERKSALELVVTLEQKISEASNQLLENKNQIAVINGQIVTSENDILNISNEILDSQDKINNKTKETTANVENQSRAYAVLQDFVNKYSEEIDAAQRALAASIEFIATLQDEKARKAQERIDKYTEQLDELNNEEADRQSRLVEYENELKDANGERYDELLSMIEMEKEASLSAQTEIQDKQAEIDAQTKKRAEAEYKAAKWRKAQAIVDGLIAGALAVIKALPNVFLSIATGIASAAGVATIIAQKVPEPTGFKVGGFTGGSDPNKVAGVVHEAEYVAPAFVTRSAEGQSHIAALEAQRLRGYATGGFVTPANSNASSSMIDYEMMAIAFYDAVSNLPNPEVSVVKIANGLVEVGITKKNAGLNR